jgi:hypothetical protein
MASALKRESSIQSPIRCGHGQKERDSVFAIDMADTAGSKAASPRAWHSSLPATPESILHAIGAMAQHRVAMIPVWPTIERFLTVRGAAVLVTLAKGSSPREGRVETPGASHA